MGGLPVGHDTGDSQAGGAIRIGSSDEILDGSGVIDYG
jgi:hypothetical protein